VRRLLFLPPCLVALVASFAGCGGSGPAVVHTDIAFVTSRDDDYAVFGMRADGSGQERLTRDAGGNGTSPQEVFFQVTPDWSPDGERIVFVSRRDGYSHIYVMKADGSGTTRLTSGKHVDAGPAWSPDGSRIAFARDGAISMMATNGDDVRRVMGALGGEEFEPAWAPDGKWLAYVRRDAGFSSHEIWRVRPDGSDRRRVTRLNVACYGPAWSPDGSQIVFSSNVRDGRFQLYEIGADGKGLRRLTFQPGEYFDPSWSPDGKTLIFERDGLVYTRVRGALEVALTDGPNDGNPAWRPVQPESSGY
jgi:Tol biopolymer transport system component